MKQLLFVSLVCASCAVVAETLTPEEIEDLKVIEREGGLLDRAVEGDPIRVVNVQKRVSEASVRSAIAPARETLGLPLFVERASVRPAMTGIDKGIVMALVDEPNGPTLLVAPENRFVSINVAALSTDDPSPEKLRLRLEKEIFRACGYVLGAAQSSWQPCIMRTISSLKELDGLISQAPHPETQNKINDGTTQLGIGRLAFATYAGACAEGWAPPPTNEVQRSWYEKVYKTKHGQKK